MRYLFYNLILIFVCAFNIGITSKADNVELRLEDDIINYFSCNLEEMKEGYEVTFGEAWNATKVKYYTDVYNFDDVKIGYVVAFDIGYVAFGENYELLSMSNNYILDYLNEEKIYCNAKELYKKINNNFYTLDGVKWDEEITGKALVKSDIFHKLSNEFNNDDFKLSSCCTRISYLADKFTNFNFGNYKIASFYQGGTTDCGVIAIMNLIYSYYFSNVADFTHSKTSDEMRKDLRGLTNWQGNIVGEGMLPMDLVRGCNNYINKKSVKLNALESGDFDDSVFGIGLYMNLNIGETAHFALRVGTASQKYWWIFRTYWDIIATWDSNIIYENGYPTGTNDNDCYYVVDQQYRHGEYQLCRSYGVIK